MTYPVKLLHSKMRGAPILNGIESSGLNVFQGALIDGFGELTATSVVITGGKAVFTFGAGLSFDKNAIVLVSGSSVSSLNGEQKVAINSNNTITVNTLEPNGTATGTIKVRYAPLGFIKDQTGLNIAGYKSSNTQSTQWVFRVDDTAGDYLSLRAYSTMTDIDNGSDVMPGTKTAPENIYWPKSDSRDTNPTSWVIFGDDSGFYYGCNPETGDADKDVFIVYYIGDAISYKSVDRFKFIITGSEYDTISTWSTYGNYCISKTNNTYLKSKIGKDVTGFGNNVDFVTLSSFETSSGNSGDGSYGLFPNRADNSLILGKVLIKQADCLRGHMPGYYFNPQKSYDFFNSFDRIPGTGDMVNRELIALIGGQGATYKNSAMFFDVTGPWR